jgi:hypothetical protein
VFGDRLFKDGLRIALRIPFVFCCVGSIHAHLETRIHNVVEFKPRRRIHDGVEVQVVKTDSIIAIQ